MPRKRTRGRLIKDVLPEEIAAACDRRRGDEPPDWNDPFALSYLRWVPRLQEAALRAGLLHADVRILAPDGVPIMVQARVDQTVPVSGPIGNLPLAVEMAKIVFDKFALLDVMECVGITDVDRYCRALSDLLRSDLKGEASRHERII